MKTIILTILIPGIILFFLLDLVARELLRKLRETKLQAEREAALADSLRLDFTRESKTLRRVEVENPVARILCVDDEEVILDSFRKILVLDGYSVDTVETGQEALGLIQARDYDFVFTDLKMPEMSGTDVAKSVKHLRPDIDVVVITGYATVESAVECMQHGVMDYIEKPFSEDELREFVKHTLIRRLDRIQNQLKPVVHVMGPGEKHGDFRDGFSITGGVLFSDGHSWASLAEDGTARVGLDDFARKLIGRVDSIDFPNIGMNIKAGDPLFSVNQGHRRAQFHSPLSGKVVKINEELRDDLSMLEETPYGESWVCVVDGADLDAELPRLKIGKSAVAFFQEDIERFRNFLREDSGEDVPDSPALSIAALENLDDSRWESGVRQFFGA